MKLCAFKSKAQHDQCCSLSSIHWGLPSFKTLPVSHSSLAHPPLWILIGRAFEIHSHFIQQWTWTMLWDMSSAPPVPCRAGLHLTPHSQISYGIKWFIWLSSAAGLNSGNLMLFGSQGLGELPVFTKEKIQSSVDCHWVWIKCSRTISLLTSTAEITWSSCDKVPDLSSVCCKAPPETRVMCHVPVKRPLSSDLQGMPEAKATGGTFHLDSLLHYSFISYSFN